METKRNRSKRVLIVGALVALAAAASVPLLAVADSNQAAMVTTTPPAEKATAKIRMGVYDPYGAFNNDSRVKIEHIYIPWQDVDLSSLDAVDQYAMKRGRDILMTVEPWTWSTGSTVTPEALQAGIMSGQYDKNIADVCQKSGDLKSAVTIRWGQEMDLANERYPWSQWTPAQYVAAYRYFVDHCRKVAPKVAYMWSPRGEANLGKYYPGDTYVDVIGVSLFGLEQYDKDVHGQVRTIAQVAKETYDRVAPFKKGIFFAEFGCEGERRYKEDCLEDLFTPGQQTQFPQLKAIVYFNEVESFPWPSSYGQPDWRIMPKTPGSFAQTKPQ